MSVKGDKYEKQTMIHSKGLKDNQIQLEFFFYPGCFKKFTLRQLGETDWQESFEYIGEIDFICLTTLVYESQNQVGSFW